MDPSAFFRKSGFLPRAKPHSAPVTRTSSPAKQHRIGEMESLQFYHGLPSQPRLLARSSTWPWSILSGQHAYPPSRSLHPILDDQVAAKWDEIAPKVALMAPQNWVSMDVVHLACEQRPEEEEDIIWISVLPETCSQDEAHLSVSKIRSYLATVPGFTHFHCHVRESSYIRSTRSGCTELSVPFDVGGIGGPIQVGARGGTLGAYVKSVADASMAYLTARHTVLDDSDLAGHPQVSLWTDPSSWRKGTTEVLKSARTLAARPGEKGAQYQPVVAELEACLRMSEDPRWLRMGRVLEAPPIALLRYTRDVAVIKLEDDSIRKPMQGSHHIWMGNRTDLEWMELLGEVIELDDDRRLSVRGVIEAVRPGTRVLKRGSRTGITVGTVHGPKSKRRNYDTVQGMVDELCILGDNRTAFSEKGDSGSVILTPAGMVAGLVTGGMGATDATDVTYATPFSWLLEQLGGRYVLL